MRLSEWFTGPEKWNKGSYIKCKPQLHIMDRPLESKEIASVCLLGAVRLCEQHEIGRNSLELYYIKAIKELFPSRVPSASSRRRIVPYFNDHPDTTFEDIQKVINYVETNCLHLEPLPCQSS